MFGFGKKKNESVLRQMDGREIKYVTRRIKLPDGNVDEEILGKTGRMIAINGEIRVMCGERDVFRSAAEKAVYFDLLSGAGVTISGINEIDGEQMDIIVYYTYHRK